MSPCTDAWIQLKSSTLNEKVVAFLVVSAISLSVSYEMSPLGLAVRVLSVAGLFVYTRVTPTQALSRIGSCDFVFLGAAALAILSVLGNPMEELIHFHVLTALPYFPLLYLGMSAASHQQLRAIFFPLLLIFPIQRILNSEFNDNLLLFLLIGLIPLAIQSPKKWIVSLEVLLIVFSICLLRTWSALLILPALVAANSIKKSLVVGACAVLLLFTLSAIFEPNLPLLHSRDLVWEQAVHAFWASPVWGGTFPVFTLPGGVNLVYAHNIVLTMAANHGVIGILIAAALFYGIFKRWILMPYFARVGVILYGVFSIIDEPLHFFSSLTVFCALVSRGSGAAVEIGNNYPSAVISYKE